jgi:hypothetical protein
MLELFPKLGSGRIFDYLGLFGSVYCDLKFILLEGFVALFWDLFYEINDFIYGTIFHILFLMIFHPHFQRSISKLSH